MADKILKLSQLSIVKSYINSKDADSYKSATYNNYNRTVSFYKTADASGSPSFQFTLPEGTDVSGKADKVASATAGDFASLDITGNLADSGVSASDFASSDDVGDVDDLETESKTVVGAINEIKNTVPTMDTYTIKRESSTEYVNVYKLYKNYVSTENPGTQVGDTINIPKDMVVQSGEIVDNPSGQQPGKYLKLIIANQSTPIYIPVGELCDVYTPASGASKIQLSISDSHVISANVVSHSIGLSDLTTSVGASLTKADNSVQSVTATGSSGSDGTITVDGSEVEVKGVWTNTDFVFATDSEVQAIFT